ncbi:MAG: DUF4384 domain-containing protein [Myxococcota bacterium]
MDCLDDVAMEKVLLGAADQVSAAHAGACPACHARLEALRAQGEDFQRFVFPSTVDAVTDAVAPGRRARWWWALGPAAVAAALVVSLWPRGPAEDYVGLKGAAPALGLTVYTLDGQGGAVAVADGASLPADATLRFTVNPSAPCYLWLVSIDGQGQVSKLFPASGEAAWVTQATTLPGGAVLDGVPGPERLVAVCSPEPVGFEQLEAAVTRHSADEVRRAFRLPVGGGQASVLVEKRAP